MPGLSVDEAARTLKVDSSRIRQRLSGDPRSLFGVKVGKAWRVPRFQFDGKRVAPGLGSAEALMEGRLLLRVLVEVWRSAELRRERPFPVDASAASVIAARCPGKCQAEPCFCTSRGVMSVKTERCP